MDTAHDLQRSSSAGDANWRPMYETALVLMAKGEHAMAADLLRVLAIAAPNEPEVWQALATCHDEQNQVDIAEALRSLGRLLQPSFGPKEKP